MNRIYFANKGHTRKHGCPNLFPVTGPMFHRAPREIFSEPGLVAYVDPKLINHSYFEARISIYNTSEIIYRPNWNNDGEHMSGGCIMNATYAIGHVNIDTVVKARENRAFDDSEATWNSRAAAINLLKEAVIEFRQYFPHPGNPV